MLKSVNIHYIKMIKYIFHHAHVPPSAWILHRTVLKYKINVGIRLWSLLHGIHCEVLRLFEFQVSPLQLLCFSANPKMLCRLYANDFDSSMYKYMQKPDKWLLTRWQLYNLCFALGYVPMFHSLRLSWWCYKSHSVCNHLHTQHYFLHCMVFSYNQLLLGLR